MLLPLLIERATGVETSGHCQLWQHFFKELVTQSMKPFRHGPTQKDNNILKPALCSCRNPFPSGSLVVDDNDYNIDDIIMMLMLLLSD